MSGDEHIVENYHKTLGCIIKDARHERHMLQSELASEVGITARHLMSIENNNRKPSYDLLYKLIRTLGIPADAIFYPEREEHGFTPESVRTLIQNMNEKDMGIVIEAMKLIFTRGG